MAVDQGELLRVNSELKLLNERVAELEKLNQRLRRQLRDARANETRFGTQLATMRRTASWRLTYPFRLIARVILRKPR